MKRYSMLVLCLSLFLFPIGVSANQWSAERAVESATAVMTNGMTVFTITGGPIQIVELLSVCISANDGTASTIQWQSNPTVGSAATISGASGSLASKAAGTVEYLSPTALSTALVEVLPAAGSVWLGVAAAPNRVIVHAGTLKLVVGVGSTTGTWKHYMRYKPLGSSVMVN